MKEKEFIYCLTGEINVLGTVKAKTIKGAVKLIAAIQRTRILNDPERKSIFWSVSRADLPVKLGCIVYTICYPDGSIRSHVC
ncbi:hypothetical protein UZM3_12 [Bacteroides phage vB_BfrS_UZM3]|nr:hypothetical protein UZM3_12 [Bacteroides phage vB_BfrS_UZM3]